MSPVEVQPGDSPFFSRGDFALRTIVEVRYNFLWWCVMAFGDHDNFREKEAEILKNVEFANRKNPGELVMSPVEDQLGDSPETHTHTEFLKSEKNIFRSRGSKFFMSSLFLFFFKSENTIQKTNQEFL